MLPALLIAVLASTVLSCQQKTEVKQEQRKSEADSLLEQAHVAHDYNRILWLADSLEREHAITSAQANQKRGVAYNNLGERRKAEFYFNKVLAEGYDNDIEYEEYIVAASHLAMILKTKGDFEGALRVGLPIITNMKGSGKLTNASEAHISYTIGLCQIHLDNLADAAHNLEASYDYFIKDAKRDSTCYGQDNVAVICFNTAANYINTKHYVEADLWIQRSRMALDEYAKLPDAQEERTSKFNSRMILMEALQLAHIGKTAQAEQAYAEYMSTEFAQTSEGHLDACEYLAVANRWEEAANYFAELDDLLPQLGRSLNLDNIQQYVLPKYRAEVNAHHNDAALRTGTLLCDALDSAILWQKQNDAAELATIYETQEKERQISRNEATIAEQTASMNKQRVITVVIVLLLLILFFAIVAILRQRAAKRLAAKNEELKQKNAELTRANARAEEASKMKTNFIQQISHEIRTPLNILSGFTQVLTTADAELDDDTRKDINHQITENTNRITKLVSKMLELSDANSKALIDRNDNALAIQIALQAIDKSGITSATHLDFSFEQGKGADSRAFMTDIKMATRALTLLLDNAVKFTKPANAIEDPAASDPSLSINGAPRKPQAALYAVTTPQRVKFVVENTGKTIPAIESEHIFGEFVQLDSYYEGTGLGLTVARGLARRLGGDIILDTSYTVGARFVMTLPT